MIGHARKLTHHPVLWMPKRPIADSGRLDRRTSGYPTTMLYTIFIILAIIALLLFIFGRRRV